MGFYGASAFLAASGLAMIALSLFPSPVIHVTILGIAGLLATIGLLRGKRWGLVLALLVLFLYGAFGLSLIRALVLFFENPLSPLTAVLLLILGAFVASTVAFCLYILSKRSLFG